MPKQKLTNQAEDGRQRVVISGVAPEIEGGRFPIKRTVGEQVVVEADIFADGHDVLSAVLQYRADGEEDWQETRMEPLVNDRWRGTFSVGQMGSYSYRVAGWVDHFKSWRHDLEKKAKAGMDLSVELLVGSQLLDQAAERAVKGGEKTDATQLRAWSKALSGTASTGEGDRTQLALDRQVAGLAALYPDRESATVYPKHLRVTVDPVLARFSAWYELFPRSFPSQPGGHGTFKDCERQLERVADMGFDVLYFPPIHPIGRSFRKGKNNSPTAQPGEYGSPWAIGAAEGGHKAVHSDLGTLEDFRSLVQKARAMKLEVALDIAFQCAPDHPYVTEGKQWFRKRPDGSIQYAENPPKKYQDIYPFDFEVEDWEALWKELKSVFEFWIGQGVYIYRVDNPHTKAFPFWEWCLGELKQKFPQLIFLSEAFTRPKVMYRLAKLGFTQSYNYFPWRNNKGELTEYFTELTRSEVREYFRPNLWPNTPDILPQYLQYGGRPAFMARLVLAATLGASYGIYGPAFELCENRPRAMGTEEYLDSEKYEIKQWNLDAPGNLRELITAVNRIRRENPALHSDERLHFHPVDNDHLIAYSKQTENLENIILTVVNLDSHHAQSGWVHVDLDRLKIDPHDNYQVHDLLSGARYMWQGSRNYVELNPNFIPAHVFRLRRRVRTEQDFDYFM